MASEIKVNNIKDTCGTAVITKCGATHTVTAEVYKADTIQDTSGNAYLAKCGTTVTLGGCGQTIELASGASQTGFGRTGTVDWDTTAKTASFTAVSGTGYFVNTTSSAFTATLPAGSAGAIVSFADYAGTWQTNALTVSPQSGEKIGGTSADVALTTEGQSVTFIYVDSTQGWLNTMDSTSNVRGNPFIVATGGTITCCGDYKIHTFTSPGTFTVTNAGAPTGSNTVDYLVLAGGGGGGGNDGGGGGAGGFRESVPSPAAWTASPLASPGGALPVSAQGYPITVGGGGNGGPATVTGTNGANSIFSTITSAGGGVGASEADGGDGVAGGSGGGSNNGGNNTGPGGAGNTPPVSPPQGRSGGASYSAAQPIYRAGGGGGGAGQDGGVPNQAGNAGGGGNGVTSSINASPVTRAGGGSGGGRSGQQGAGSGGGGTGTTSGTGGNGTTNTGGGAGGAGEDPPSTPTGGNGGSGLVIIRYKYQ